MNSTVHALRTFLNDPRRARAVRRGGGALCIVLLAVLGWVAWSQGGTRLDMPMGQALFGSAMAALATALGALPALFINRISARQGAVMLGFGAGVMLAASSFSLILPGIEAGAAILGSQVAGVLSVATGLLLGAICMLFADKLVPHEHPAAGRHGPEWMHLRRVWLLVFAMALHNFPEGMAIGIGFAGGDPSVGIIPESHRKGHEQPATLGLIGGFVAMTVLDTALG